MATIETRGHSPDDLNPGTLVMSCNYLEKGSCFSLDGMSCCVHGTGKSPLIVSAEELRSGAVTYDLLVQWNRKTPSGSNRQKRTIYAC